MAIVRFFEWDQPKSVFSEKQLKKGDKVVVEHEWGTFLAEVLSSTRKETGEKDGRLIRLANSFDLETTEDNKKKEAEILNLAKTKAREMELSMKLIDSKVSLDGSCVVIAFVADGRVDFRFLVKELSFFLGKSVRLQQIGSRDEARKCGGCGICGLELCCVKFSGCLKSISTDMARCQMIVHRGSERISGLCGRLKCCLAYEADQYQEALKTLPGVGALVKLKDGKEGTVVEVQALAQRVKIELKDNSYITVEAKELK